MKKYSLFFVFLLAALATFAQPGRRPVDPDAELNRKYTSGLFSTTDGTLFDLESDENALTVNGHMNILDWLRGRVAGLQVYNHYNLRIPVIRNNVAGIFVNEMRVDPQFLNMLPVNDIALIKVIKTPFLGGWGMPGGAIAIYTKTGDDETEGEEDSAR